MLGVYAQQQTDPKPYEKFYKKDSVTLIQGAFNTYQIDSKYFLEIPESALERDILITISSVKGTTNYTSPASGTIYMKKGPKNRIEVFKNMVLTVLADSSDYCMMNAIEKSGLIPPFRSFPIVAYGPEKSSYIIELTSELNSARGLFDVHEYSMLGAPDMERSKVQGVRTVDGGVIFSVRRVQDNTYTNDQTGEEIETVASYLLEFVLQLIPEHDIALKKDHVAYGFNTVERQEYDSKKYRSFKRNYIQKWHLEASKADRKKQLAGKAVAPLRPIEIYIDPNTPEPFVEPVKLAIESWQKVFEAAGWKDVFSFTKDPSLTYKKIVLGWGLAYNSNGFDRVTDPVTGEILAVRAHFMDESALGKMQDYFVKCGLLDDRVQSDPTDMELRKLILTRLLTFELGEMLGLQANRQTLTAYSPKQVKSASWVSGHGFVPSIMGGVVFNYMAEPADQIPVSDLISKVGIYDFEAIDYAYGDRTAGPSLPSVNYKKQKGNNEYGGDHTGLSSDPIAAAKYGQQNLKKLFEQLTSITEKWPEDMNNWRETSALASKMYAANQHFLTAVGDVVGQLTFRDVLENKNQSRYEFSSREEQLAALAYLENYVFTEVPAWLDQPDIRKINPTEPSIYMVGVSKAILTHFISETTVNSLLAQKELTGDQAYSVFELFDFIDRVVFKNYDVRESLSDYQMAIQTTFCEVLAQEAANHNLTEKITDHSELINAYLVRFRDHVEAMKTATSDPKRLESYKLMLMRLDRNYFSKRV